MTLNDRIPEVVASPVFNDPLRYCSEPFRAGHAAGLAGESALGNPHDDRVNKNQHLGWMRGWNAGNARRKTTDPEPST